MYDRYQASGLHVSSSYAQLESTHHELDDVDPEMLILHRIQTNTGLAEPLYDLAIRRILEQRHVILDYQLLARRQGNRVTHADTKIGRHPA